VVSRPRPCFFLSGLAFGAPRASRQSPFSPLPRMALVRSLCFVRRRFASPYRRACTDAKPSGAGLSWAAACHHPHLRTRVFSALPEGMRGIYEAAVPPCMSRGLLALRGCGHDAPRPRHGTPRGRESRLCSTCCAGWKRRSASRGIAAKVSAIGAAHHFAVFRAASVSQSSTEPRRTGFRRSLTERRAFPIRPEADARPRGVRVKRSAKVIPPAEFIDPQWQVINICINT